MKKNVKIVDNRVNGGTEKCATNVLLRDRAKEMRSRASAIPRKIAGHCHWTVTSVPMGISEKNLRAASEGSRMQPCDAG